VKVSGNKIPSLALHRGQTIAEVAAAALKLVPQRSQ
jgi:hypothetical protein